MAQTETFLECVGGTGNQTMPAVVVEAASMTVEVQELIAKPDGLIL